MPSHPRTLARLLLICLVPAGLSACAAIPQGPTLAVLPSPNKPFEVFQGDDLACRSLAASAVSGEVEEANNRAAGSALLVAALATAAGAAIGASNNGGYHHGGYHGGGGGAGSGAAVGAGIGALGGAAVGASASQDSQDGIQRRYDIAYAQCMYARGNQVPGYQQADGPTIPPPLPPRR